MDPTVAVIKKQWVMCWAHDQLKILLPSLATSGLQKVGKIRIYGQLSKTILIKRMRGDPMRQRGCIQLAFLEVHFLYLIDNFPCLSSLYPIE